MIIIVLGAGIDKKGKLSKETAKRLKEASEMHKEKGACLLLSGKYNFPWDENNPPSVTEAEVMHDYLVSLGIDSKNIFLDKESQDTVSSACFSKTEYLIPKKEKEAFVVTSDIHLERVEYIFSKVFGKEYNLHFVAMPSALPCQSKNMILAKQSVLTEKVKEILKDVEEGDHETVKERISQSNHHKERPSWLNLDYKKSC